MIGSGKEFLGTNVWKIYPELRCKHSKCVSGISSVLAYFMCVFENMFWVLH